MSGRVLLAALATASFSVIYSSTVIAPLVTQLAAEFGTTAGSIGVVAAAYSIPGILTGALTGPLSDRYGRRPLLVGGTSVLGLGTIASAFAGDLLTLTLLRCSAGFGAAVILPNMMAAAADRFEGARRARVISLLLLANTVGGLAGIAVTGVMAERYGWRVALAIAGAIALIAAVATAAAPLRAVPRSAAPFFASLGRVLTDRSAFALLASNYVGAMSYQCWALYVVVFFERVYGLARDLASTYALVIGAGMLIGTQIGPNVSARLGPRLSLGASLSAYGLILLAVTTAAPALLIAVGAILAAAFCYGLRATSNAVLMTEQVPAARSTVLGLSQTTVAGANATAAAAGGAALDAVGFPGIGMLCLVSAVASALIVIVLVKETEGAGTAEGGAGPIVPTA